MSSAVALSCALLGLTSCLAPAPTEFRKPKKTAPVLDLLKAVPPINQLVLVNNDEPKSFRVGVQSEDDGDRLIGSLYLDFGLKGASETGALGEAPPSTLDDTSREIIVPWRVRTTSGCHQLTLFVTHNENFDVATTLPKNRDVDTAIAVWWAHVDYETSDAGDRDMPECPGLEDPDSGAGG